MFLKASYPEVVSFTAPFFEITCFDGPEETEEISAQTFAFSTITPDVRSNFPL